MDLRDLRYFETVAELLHVGKAAERLHRSQPAISGAIRRLEKTVDAPLFERDGRGISLTAAGGVLLRWAQRLRFDVEDATREVADIGLGIAGTARVGIVPTAAQFLLPRAVRELLKQAPQVRLTINVALVDVLVPMLKSGQLDIVIGTQLRRPDREVVTELLTEDFVVVAASADHEIFQRKPTLKDLVGQHWVLQSPGAPTRDWLDHTFERRGLPRPNVQVESSMLLVLPALIAQTGLLSFISRHHLDVPDTRSALREVVLKETTMRRRLVSMRRANAYETPAARLLLTLLSKTAQET